MNEDCTNGDHSGTRGIAVVDSNLIFDILPHNNEYYPFLKPHVVTFRRQVDSRRDKKISSSTSGVKFNVKLGVNTPKIVMRMCVLHSL